MDLASLRIFKTVVEQGGITRAAAKLHRVPSNVTTRVKQLEQTLGTRLFTRIGRQLALSPQGKLLLTYAEQLLRLSDEAQTMLRDGKPHGTLRLGALESTSGSRLPPLLSRYHLTYPDVQIELVTGTSGALVSRIHRQEIEAAFVAEPFNGDGLETMPAFLEELVLIAPRGARRIRSPRDIGNRTVIAFAAGCSYRRRLEAWLGAAKIAPDRVLEFQSYHAIVACVAAGTGIAVVPRSVIHMSLGEKDVAITPLPQEIAQARTRLAWRAGHHSVALQAMKTVLATKVAPSPRGRR
jgi:DNA-binding transcriptional LysR family regulator